MTRFQESYTKIIGQAKLSAGRLSKSVIFQNIQACSWAEEDLIQVPLFKVMGRVFISSGTGGWLEFHISHHCSLSYNTFYIS